MDQNKTAGWMDPKKLMKQTDLLGAGAVILIVCMLIIPLPPILIDLFITLNIAAALAGAAA